MVFMKLARERKKNVKIIPLKWMEIVWNGLKI